jgi:two-component system nitrogen regulation response regulator GlnG
MLAIVADDDRGLRRLISEVLRREGCEVVEHADGGALLAGLTHGPRPDLLVSDVHMPGGGGIEAFRLIDRLGLGIPVILVTGFLDRDSDDAARALGCEVLDKPFELEELRAAIRRALRPARHTWREREADPR